MAAGPNSIPHLAAWRQVALRTVERIRTCAYPVLLYAGAVAGIIAGTRWAAAHGLSAPKTQAAMLLLLLPALVGARLLFVVCHWELYRRQPQRILRRTEGGAALYGGLILSFLTSLALLPVLGMNLWAFWDAGAIAMLIGMVFTKAACFINGCCAGRPVERGLGLPLQLFEAGLAGLVLGGSLRVASHWPAGGSLFFIALAGYGAGRWLLEPMRETTSRIRGVSVNRVISAALVVIAIARLLLLWISQSPGASASY